MIVDGFDEMRDLLGEIGMLGIIKERLRNTRSQANGIKVNGDAFMLHLGDSFNNTKPRLPTLFAG